jgi:dTDP-4-dehydrorhamnose reductase
MKKILLTGSTSYLGTKFIELYGSHFDILGIARSDPSNPVDLLDFAAVKKIYLNFQPDIIIHTAADLGRDSTTAGEIIKTNPAATKNLVDLGLKNKIPFIFTSTEAVYGGKEQTGDYDENDPYQPRSAYGKSKVESEKIVLASGVPYLITRGHRHVGISKGFKKPKQFPDTLHDLAAGDQVHLDSRKLFKPVLINHVCDIIAHHITSNPNAKEILNIGTDKVMTYFALVSDVAVELGLNKDPVKPDGEEDGWPLNSTLSLKKLQRSGYPVLSYQQLLDTIRTEFES